MHHVETLAGATCCDIFRPDRDRKRIREVVESHAKAAPLQALGKNTPRQDAKLFEDEDDDEYEDD